MSDELKPCPFCGSGAFVTVHPRSEAHGYSSLAIARCSACGAQVTAEDAKDKNGWAVVADGKEKAIVAWNTRAASTAEVAGHIETIEAENARLREDAARYRYLRNRDCGPEGKPPPRGLFIGMVPENLILTEEHADLAIDQARKAHRHSESGEGGGDE